MQDEISVIGKAVFFIEGDPIPYQTNVVSWKDCAWFVANYLSEKASGKLIPMQLIPMSRLDHIQELSLFRLTGKIPKALLNFPAPETLLREYAGMDAPGVFGIQTGKPIH